MPSEVLGLNLSQAQVITKYLNLFTIQPRLVSSLKNENISILSSTIRLCGFAEYEGCIILLLLLPQNNVHIGNMIWGLM